MPRQTKEQKKTVERVMHEYKHGELERGRGGKVKNPQQAIAIALREAGASKYRSPAKNREDLARTKEKERRGETAQQEIEGRMGASPRRRTGSTRQATRAELYERAKRRKIPGRSRMSKDELAQALRR